MISRAPRGMGPPRRGVGHERGRPERPRGSRVRPCGRRSGRGRRPGQQAGRRPSSGRGSAVDAVVGSSCATWIVVAQPSTTRCPRPGRRIHLGVESDAEHVAVCRRRRTEEDAEAVSGHLGHETSEGAVRSGELRGDDENPVRVVDEPRDLDERCLDGAAVHELHVVDEQAQVRVGPSSRDEVGGIVLRQLLAPASRSPRRTGPIAGERRRRGVAPAPASRPPMVARLDDRPDRFGPATTSRRRPGPSGSRVGAASSPPSPSHRPSPPVAGRVATVTRSGSAVIRHGGRPCASGRRAAPGRRRTARGHGASHATRRPARAGHHRPGGPAAARGRSGGRSPFPGDGLWPRATARPRRG